MDSAIVSKETPSLGITTTYLEEWYDATTDMLWFQASYCFAKPKLLERYDKLMSLILYSMLVNAITINICMFMLSLIYITFNYMFF